MKTFQQIFDIVATHLLTQNAKSSDGDTCLYRGPSNTKCAVGVLIKDKYYSSNLESRGVDDEPQVQEALKKSGIPTDEVTMERLQVLQTIHDVDKVEKWPKALRRFAKNRHLSAKVVGETLKKINR